MNSLNNDGSSLCNTARLPLFSAACKKKSRPWAGMLPEKIETPRRGESFKKCDLPLPNQLIWAICGPTLGMIRDKLWAIYGYYMVLIWAMASHTKSINATVFTSVPFHCLSLWDCYVFRKVPYIPQSIWYGNDMG